MRWLMTYASNTIDPRYPVYPGLFNKEAIMLLRRFYVQENKKGRSCSLFRYGNAPDSVARTGGHLLTIYKRLILDRRRIGS